MSLTTYANFQTAIADQLARSDLTSQIVDCITLFEAEATYELWRTRGNEKTTILIPTTPAALNVTNAANNGSGAIRLTISSTSTLSTNQEIVVANVGGTTEANGSWVITVVTSTTLDLVGSTFTNAYTTGGTVQALQGTCALPSDYLAWRRATWTGNPRSDLDYVHPSIFQAYFPTQPADTPQFFTIEGSTFKVMPTSGTPIEFDYYATTAALSGNLNWLFTNHVDCYWSGVLEQCYSYVKDYDQAGVFRQLKEASYNRIKKQRFDEGDGLRVQILGPAP